MQRPVILGALILTVGWGAIRCPAQAPQWRAGTAREKITPRSPMWMAGYGSRSHVSTGLHGDLWAKALVLEDARGVRATIITLDLVGIGRDLAEPILSELKDKHGCDPGQVAICCSHTHSGPVVGHNLRTMHYDLLDREQQGQIDDYARRLKQSLVELVGRAVASLEPCRISWGDTSVAFAVNRRNNKEPDVPRLRAAGQLVGPVDHDVPVLKVENGKGQLVAVLFGYACHATVLDGYEWSPDYPGFAQAELERMNPGCTALFFAGCGADQNPLPRRSQTLAVAYGHDLAEAVQAMVNKELQPLSGDLGVRSRELHLSLANVPTSDEVAADAKSSDKYVAARARAYQDRLAHNEPILATVPYPIRVWKLGDRLVFVALGGEVVVDYALRIKQEFPGQPTWVAGYSNDVMAYIPSRRVLAEGGYEGGGAMVYYGLPSAWAPTVEESIIAAVKDLMRGRD